MRQLDRSRPYGQVCGDGVAHAFEQDGARFDAAGNEMVTAQERAAEVRDKRKAKPDPVADQLAAQLEG
jgi:hypothetical protein